MSELRKRFELAEPLGTVLLLVLAVSCAGLLFAQPRATAARELPSLTLPQAPVQRALQADARAARSAPTSDKARALDTLFLEHGRLEAEGLESVERYQRRRKAMIEAYREVATELGAEAALRLRERALEKLEAALALRLRDTEAKAVLGSFTAVLAREGASRDGEIVAPHFVVRTLYKARWNLLHGLARDHAFSDIEKRTYYGWQALHAERVPVLQRIQALHTYGQVGGEDVEEALGVLLMRQGDAAQAARAFEHAYRKNGSLRLRNAWLGAQRAAEAAD